MVESRIDSLPMFMFGNEAQQACAYCAAKQLLQSCQHKQAVSIGVQLNCAFSCSYIEFLEKWSEVALP